MKQRHYIIPILIFFLQISIFAQEPADSTGMLGDNFSLEGALELFKQSESPEEFEKKLNQEDTYVNNLDLNQDGQIDYIKVIDYSEGKSHALVLQTDLNENESQDIAVIEMEKTAENQVVLQIVGNEELYGEDTYLEPNETQNTDITIVNQKAPVTGTVVVNVWSWPSVRYIYGPRYHVWVSPWRWGYYPVYWRPWRPHPWRWHYNRRVHYRVYYHPVYVHRVYHAHALYKPHRRTSVVVTRRSTTIRTSRRNKNVVKTKKTTTTVGIKKSNGKIVAGKKTTKTVKTKKGTKTTTKTTTFKKNRNKTTVKKTKTTKRRRKKRR